MFNVRPNAPSPWLYVEQPPEDELPAFRVAPDGSVIDAKRRASSASVAPPTGTDFENAVRLVAGGLYGPADIAMLPRNQVQEALDQIRRIYAGFGPRPASLLDRQAPGTNMATPIKRHPEVTPLRQLKLTPVG